MTSSMVWEHVKGSIIQSSRGCIIFDDSILDKNHSHKIELVQRQYSGNAHGLIKGIGMVNCLYVNPDNGQYWVVDYRIYDPQGDGKSKFDHILDMLLTLVSSQRVAFDRVLIDSWYGAKDFLQKVCATRWKIEKFHRELKQVTGIEKCQCRKARIQRNHIACAVLVWIRLTELARSTMTTMTTIYKIKSGLLAGYLRQELRSRVVSRCKKHQ